MTKSKKEINDLETYFLNNEERLIHKWNHYFDIYDRHFRRYRDTDVVVLEIGVSHGGSLQMWKQYFGTKARIYGIDINPKCKKLEEKNIQIFIGSHSDRDFLTKIKNSIPKVDILIDDGGHTMRQQITSFEELFYHVKTDGIYLSEDLMTSYWIKQGGGYKRRGTFIEYSKKFIDYLNAYHSRQKKFAVNAFTKSVDSIHYYDSMIVIEKAEKSAPFPEKSGNISVSVRTKQKKLTKSTMGKIKYQMLVWINLILRFFRLPSYRW